MKKLSIVFLILAILIAFAPKKIPVIDNKTEQFLNNTIKTTLISYASIRGINAVVSIIKHSSLDIQPGGMGITIGAGEILDPVDDLTERVSDVLFLALVSMGAMEVLYNISLPVFNILMAFVFIFLAASFMFEKYKKILFNIAKILLIVASIRVVFPIIAYSGNYLNGYFQTQINEVRQNLNILSVKNKNLFELPSSNGFFDAIKTNVEFVKMKVTEIKENFLKIYQNLNKIITSLVKLAYLYVSMFLINIVLIPLIFYLFLKKLLGLREINIEG